MTDNLTEGNKRIREIIYEYLEYYRELNSRSTDTLKYFDLYSQVINRFSSDPIITSDIRVSQSLYHHEISDNYLDWLYFNSSYQKIDGGKHRVKLDRFVYETTFPFDPTSGEDMFAYQGGDRSHSTISCLFGLADDNELDKLGWHSTYFKKEEILQCIYGHHRLLANVLWGNENIRPGSITLVDESIIDRQLHDALLKIEDYLRKYSLFFAVESGCDARRNYLEEAVDIKYFLNEVESKEMNTIGDFANPNNHNNTHTYFEGRTLNINSLKKLIGELREFQSRSIIRKIIIRARRKLSDFGETSYFKEWLFNNISRYY
jgi:hypothetical protein